MVILYEGNRRDFFIKRRAEGARCHKHQNSQAKGLLPDRTLESFGRSTKWAIPNF